MTTIHFLFRKKFVNNLRINLIRFIFEQTKQVNMRNERVQIEFNFINLVVDGIYSPAEYDTNSPSEFDIQKIFLLNDSDEQDIYNLVDCYIDEIKHRAIKFIEE